MDQETLLRNYACVRVSAVTRWHPDGPDGPVTAHPWHFVFQSDPAAWYAWTATQRLFVEGRDEGRARLVRAARAAIEAGDRAPEIDTAVGRYITQITLDFEGLQGRRQASCSVNHHERRHAVSAGAWLELLHAMGDLLFDHLDEEGRLALRRLLVWFAAPSPPGWEAGLVSPCPPQARFVPIPLGPRGFFVRVGQPPGPSSLFSVTEVGGALAVREVGPGRDLALLKKPEVNREQDHERPGATTSWTSDAMTAKAPAFRGEARSLGLEWDGGPVVLLHAFSNTGVYVQRA